MSDACARYRLTTEEFLNWQIRWTATASRACVPPVFKSTAVGIGAWVCTTSAGQASAPTEIGFWLPNTGPEGAGNRTCRVWARPFRPA